MMKKILMLATFVLSMCVANAATSSNASTALSDEPMTIAAVKAAYDNQTLAKNDSVWVKGYIVNMFQKPNNFATYGSVCFWLTDTLGGTAKEFELYNCYGIDKDTFGTFNPYVATGSKYVDMDTAIGRNGLCFATGDYVEAKGKFTVYQGTYELQQNCYITKGGNKVATDAANVAKETATGTKKVLLNNQFFLIIDGVMYTIYGTIVK